MCGEALQLGAQLVHRLLAHVGLLQPERRFGPAFAMQCERRFDFGHARVDEQADAVRALKLLGCRGGDEGLKLPHAVAEFLDGELVGLEILGAAGEDVAALCGLGVEHESLDFAGQFLQPQ